MKKPTLIVTSIGDVVKKNLTIILITITTPSLYAQPGESSDAPLNISELLIIGGIFLFIKKEYSKKMNPQNRMLLTVAGIIIFLILLTFQFAKAQGH